MTLHRLFAHRRANRRPPVKSSRVAYWMGSQAEQGKPDGSWAPRNIEDDEADPYRPPQPPNSPCQSGSELEENELYELRSEMQGATPRPCELEDQTPRERERQEPEPATVRGSFSTTVPTRPSQEDQYPVNPDQNTLMWRETVIGHTAQSDLPPPPVSPSEPLDKEDMGSGHHSGESSDTEWLSVSDTLEGSPHELGTISLPWFADALDRTFVSYASWKTHAQQNGDPGRAGDRRSEQTKKGERAGESPRKRVQDDESSNEEGNSSPRGTSAKKLKTELDTQKLLACPFWKKSPHLYRDCFSRKLSRIRDVKQHIHRRHEPPSRCPRCGEIFASDEIRDSHARAEPACEVRHVVHNDLTHSQMKALRKKSLAKSTVEEQWFTMWDIVFPGVERPSSPYLDQSLSEELSSFHEFYQANGPSILRETLEQNSVEIATEQRYNDAILCAGLNAIFHQWLTSQTEHGSLITSVAERSGTVFPSADGNADNSNSESQVVSSESSSVLVLSSTETQTLTASSELPWMCMPTPHLTSLHLWEDFTWVPNQSDGFHDTEA
ncbi:hypothetical protein BJY01DRAFT_250530 [Aspergillus pseudoustus]|uniref:C2H2-type domain-containing protein n=1 Tax=Aspergillus pseudoustus TaxID=1810923 RepID=A0ABR4JH32_9EURO